MNDRLNELIEQKKAIEAEIKAIKEKENGIVAGGAKVAVEHYPTGKPDRHYVAIKLDMERHGGMRKEWRTIVNGNSREEVIGKIPRIINDLQALYDTVTGGEK